MADYKCVHCKGMFSSPQEWLEHCQLRHGDKDLKVFVRHVSFSEKAFNRRPMFVLKNFHMNAKDLDGKQSTIDSDLRVKTSDVNINEKLTSDRNGNSNHDTLSADITRIHPRKLSSVGKSRSLDVGGQSNREQPESWQRTVDDAILTSDSSRTSPWWQQAPVMSTRSRNGSSSTIHRGTGSLRVTLSNSSLAERDMSLASMDYGIDGPLTESVDRDIADSVDLANLDIHQDHESSRNSSSNQSRGHPGGDNSVVSHVNDNRHEEHINSGSHNKSHTANLLSREQRHTLYGTKSPYLGSSDHGLGGNWQQTAEQPLQGTALSARADSDVLRDAPLRDLKLTTFNDGFVSNNGNGHNEDDFSHDGGDRCHSLPIFGIGTPVTDVDRLPSTPVAADDIDITNHKCSTPTAEKVTRWINENKFTDIIPDGIEQTDNGEQHISLRRDIKHITENHNSEATSHIPENMGNGYSGSDAKSFAKKYAPGAFSATKPVRGTKDIGKFNNRYSAGALIDIAHTGASWVIPRGQAASSTRTKTLVKQRAQDDIDIARMPEYTPVDAFRRFSTADSFDDTVKAFDDLCLSIGLRQADRHNSYNEIKKKVDCSEATKFFRLLDARGSHEEYGGGKICKNTTVLVIGGGPCGLRTAIECALLGAKVVVLEMRNYATRNNVLHLWPTATKDIRSIGAKVFYPKFCAGAIHHVSIRRLQLILMKTALILGVEIHSPVTFEELLQPNPKKGTGWKARLSPASCPANNLEFEVLIGADGKRNILDFPRKFTRGKVSIAITANFKNPASGMHARVGEIPGVISVKRPDLFGELKNKTGMEFENFVYFRDETHYFVMTAKKKSIVEKGIVKKETADLRAMFHPKNLNHDKLLDAARSIAETAWRVDNPSFTSMPDLEFVMDRYGKEDVAIFDFAALHQAEHACMIKERHGKKLLACIVGDTLLEPFWPTGSGIAKGFLGCLDAAWTIRNWSDKKMSDLEVIAERESIFRVLPQVTPDNLVKDNCTIDPRKRYGASSYGWRLPLDTVKVKDVQHLYNTGDAVKRKSCGLTVQELPKEKRRLYRGGSIDTHRLVGWYKEKLSTFAHIVKVSDLAKSWNTGLALCALIQTERPDLMDVNCLDRNNCRGNIQRAFEIIEKEFGVEQMMSADDLAQNDEPDRLTMMSYLFHIYEFIMTKDDDEEISVSGIDQGGPTANPSLTTKASASRLLHTVANSAILLRTLQYDAQRVKDMDLDSLARSANKTGRPSDMNYFLKTASLDRRAKSKVHMAVRRTKTTKTEQVARKWRKRVQDKKQKKLQQNENVETTDKKQKKNTEPQSKYGKQKENAVPKSHKDTNIVPKTSKPSDEPNVTDKEANKPGERRNVKFADDAKEVDGPLELRGPEMDEETRRMMSLPRQACGGIASKGIQAFRALENKEQTDQDENPHKLDHIDSEALGEMTTEENKSLLKHRSPIRNTKTEDTAKKPGIDTDPDGNPHKVDHVDSEPLINEQITTEPEPRSPIIRRDAFRCSDELSSEENKSPLKRRSAVRQSKTEDTEKKPGIDTLKRTGDICCLCNKKLYFVERHNAQGFFVHRQCLKCDHCNTNLRVGNYVMLETTPGNPKYYCYAHAYQAGALDVKWGGTKTEEKDDDTLKKSQEKLDSDFCGPLTEDEQLYIDDEDDDDDDTEEEDDGLDETFNANLPYISDGSLTMRSILADLDSKDGAEGQLPGGDFDDLGSDVTDTSSHLLQQEVIQQGLEDIEAERGELEEEGVQLEKRIRGEAGDRISKCGDDMMNEWLEVARKKSELKEKESKLMLQLRLMGLQERLRSMLDMMPVIDETATVDMEAKVEKMEAVTEKMEKAAIKDDLMEMMSQMRQMKSFLGSGSNSKC